MSPEQPKLHPQPHRDLREGFQNLDPEAHVDQAIDAMMTDDEKIDQAFRDFGFDETKAGPEREKRPDEEIPDLTDEAEPILEGSELIAAELEDALAELETEAGGREKLLSQLADFNLDENASLSEILAAREIKRSITEAMKEREAERNLEDAYTESEDTPDSEKADVATELKDFKFTQEKNGYMMHVAHIGKGEFLVSVAGVADVQRDAEGGRKNRYARGMAGGTFRAETAQVVYNVIDSLSRDLATADNMEDIQSSIAEMGQDLSHVSDQAKEDAA